MAFGLGFFTTEPVELVQLYSIHLVNIQVIDILVHFFLPSTGFRMYREREGERKERERGERENERKRERRERNRERDNNPSHKI